MPDIFDTLKIGIKTSKNRLMLPPMVCFGYGADDGFVTERHISHYEKMARGGTGIVVVEGTCVCEKGRLSTDQLGIWDDGFINGLQSISGVIHKYGSIALIQIHHAGLKAPAEVCNMPIAPSYYEDKSGKRAREMSSFDIEDISRKFALAANRAKEAGFDGIELHGCHGYLINQFLSGIVNNRRDRYGADKSLFGTDILKNVRERVGCGFIIGVRIPGNEPDVKTSCEYAKAFEEAGADYLSVSYGFTREMPSDLTYGEASPYSVVVAMGSEIRKQVNVPVAVVFGINTPEEASHIIKNDMADIVAVGRGLLADSDWIVKTKSGESVNICLKCKECLAYHNMDKCSRP